MGQIAKIKRCRAIGVAGSDEKVEFITKELGFDGGFNYKTTEDYHAKLKELCPTGIDIYFDNVGGDRRTSGRPSSGVLILPKTGAAWLFHPDT